MIKRSVITYHVACPYSYPSTIIHKITYKQHLTQRISPYFFG